MKTLGTTFPEARRQYPKYRGLNYQGILILPPWWTPTRTNAVQWPLSMRHPLNAPPTAQGALSHDRDRDTNCSSGCQQRPSTVLRARRWAWGGRQAHAWYRGSSPAWRALALLPPPDCTNHRSTCELWGFVADAAAADSGTAATGLSSALAAAAADASACGGGGETTVGSWATSHSKAASTEPRLFKLHILKANGPLCGGDAAWFGWNPAIRCRNS
mmetsp:Transcript_102787/g.329653  ORF Transcript_102787/g.329653 Transcript_102787/m.329653 type:complete len:216 (+) Transcript_102787:29-676(+)